MSDVCFKPGTGPVQSFELDGYTFTDLDGTQCYSKGDLIRDQYGRVVNPNGREIDAFKREWKIDDLAKINIGTANAVISSYRQAETFAAVGNIKEVKRHLNVVLRQQPYSGMVYDQERVNEILSWAETQHIRNENQNSFFSKFLQLIPFNIPLGLVAGLTLFGKGNLEDSTI